MLMTPCNKPTNILSLQHHILVNHAAITWLIKVFKTSVNIGYIITIVAVRIIIIFIICGMVST